MQSTQGQAPKKWGTATCREVNKTYSDASMGKGLTRAGLGGVARSHEGRLQGAFRMPFCCHSSDIAKAAARRERMPLAKEEKMG